MVVAQFVTLLIETIILFVALTLAGQTPLVWLPILLVLYGLWALFTTGVALALSAANVFFHDVQYLWSIVSQLLFYATPVIYFIPLIKLDALRNVANYGPTGSFIVTFHDVLYDGRMPSIARVGYLAVLAAFTLAAGAWIFGKLSPRFAEQM